MVSQDFLGTSQKGTKRLAPPLDQNLMLAVDNNLTSIITFVSRVGLGVGGWSFSAHSQDHNELVKRRNNVDNDTDSENT